LGNIEGKSKEAEGNPSKPPKKLQEFQVSSILLQPKLTWKLTRDDKIEIKVLIPSTDTKAKR
jgi:hypothetical protein